MDTLSPLRIRQIALIAVLVALGMVILAELYALLPAFLGAVTLFILLDKPQRWLTEKYRLPLAFSSVVLMIFSLAAIALPLAGSIYVVAHKAGLSRLNQQTILDLLTSLEDGFYDLTGYHLATEETLHFLASHAEKIIPRMLGSFGNIVLNGVVMYFLLFFLLTERRLFQRLYNRLVPLRSGYALRLQRELKFLILANAIGIPLLALVQAGVAMAGYALIGIPDPIFWGLITGIASMVPILGTMLVWVPMALYQVSLGNYLTALWVLLYGFLVIGGSDNVARLILQKRLGNIHPLTTFLGVFLGLNLFGFLGLIFGPVLIATFFLLLRFYAEEYGRAEDSPLS
ncbi:MAG: AI-2E family transporter [Flavobacteriales bacterium]|nr:AI-2E family transporter [Flavobacteriales bacterium]MCX7768440.1 AI-2E family transporter [Flavobacteriales bacterium]MDW8409667.1 AI-2E family transporter [Flavobacteriales bacterium]